MLKKLGVLAVVVLGLSGCKDKQAAVAPPQNPHGALNDHLVSPHNKGEKTWLALPQLELDPGDEIEYPDKPPMVNFESKTLKRTFDTVVLAQGIRVVKCVAGKVHGRTGLPASGAP